MTFTFDKLDPARIRDRSAHRRQIEILLRLARRLSRRDYLMLDLRFNRGLALSDIARLLDLPRQSIHYQLDALLRHLQSPLFRYVLAHEDDLPETVRQIAHAIVLQRLTYRQAARHTRRSLHEIRQTMLTLQIHADHHFRQPPTTPRNPTTRIPAPTPVPF